MKICPKCHQKYRNELFFCKKCGTELIENKIDFSKLNITKILVLCIVLFCFWMVFSEVNKTNKAISDSEDYQQQKQLEEYLTTPTKYDLKINRDWSTSTRNDYIYIKGTVTNTSSTKTINYYEIEAKFIDRTGKVIDSDYTNDASSLGPGESRKFEIMHKRPTYYRTIKLSVKKVS